MGLRLCGSDQPVRGAGLSGFGGGIAHLYFQLGNVRFGSALSQSLTLKDLLDRMGTVIPIANSGAKFWMEPGVEPETMKLCLRHEAGLGRPIADGFGLLILIDAVRMTCGPEWRPKRFWLDRSAGENLSGFEALSDGAAVREVDHTAFEIPLKSLHLPIRLP